MASRKGVMYPTLVVGAVIVVGILAGMALVKHSGFGDYLRIVTNPSLGSTSWADGNTANIPYLVASEDGCTATIDFDTGSFTSTDPVGEIKYTNVDKWRFGVLEDGLYTYYTAFDYDWTVSRCQAAYKDGVPTKDIVCTGYVNHTIFSGYQTPEKHGMWLTAQWEGKIKKSVKPACYPEQPVVVLPPPTPTLWDNIVAWLKTIFGLA